MELLLKKTIDLLGRIGDVVSVKSGYARNYLLPKGFAVLVTKENLAKIDKERALALAEEAKRVGELSGVSKRLAGTSVTIEGRANQEGHLFGSVSAANIADALKQKGFAIDAKAVKLDAPLKEIGVFDVQIHLHADVEATTKVWVVQSKPE